MSDKKAVLEAFHEHGNASAGARALNMPRTTFVSALKSAMSKKDSPVRFPVLPSGNMPINEVVEHLTKNSQAIIGAQEARKWIKVPVHIEGPMGVFYVGDPHVDDDGCNWTVLREHIAVIKKHRPYISTVGLGDYQNNWVGRLAHLYGNQETSAKTAWRLVEWLIKEMGFDLLLSGNHDMWSGAGDPLKWMARNAGAFTAEWICHIELRFPGGRIGRVLQAHDFPGHSMWNPLHSPQRKAMVGGARAHLYIAGHRHVWGIAQHEDPESNHVYWLARARGYKQVDDYAAKIGHESQKYGHSILAVFNPSAGPAGFLNCFADVEAGADWLAWLRKRK